MAFELNVGGFYKKLRKRTSASSPKIDFL